ncbi:hypothetical protein [Halobaculum sp. P14]|uniref:hypothetical protein n=1 Tax=Halobaculum sp. P14 TaxID=3421638 RepID=UPI003EB6F70F
MFEVRCLSCGATEGDGVRVIREPQAHVATGGDRMLSEHLKTTFSCSTCSTSVTVNTGVHPTSRTTEFETVESRTESSLKLFVDNREISFESVDEKFSKDFHYTPQGVGGSSYVHHLHIQVFDPPTIRKGVHKVQLGELIETEMTLGKIRYHDDQHRTLKFYKRISENPEDPVRQFSSDPIKQ